MKKKKEKNIKSKTLVIAISVFLTLCILGGALFWFFNNQKGEDMGIVQKESVEQMEDTVEIVRVKEGSCEDIVQGCIADVLVRSENKEYILNGIKIFGELSVEDAVQNQDDNDKKYYILDFGTSNCRSTYLFGNGYISDLFPRASGGPNRNLFWNGYYIYEDCGIAGNNIEMITDISMLNISNNQISTIVEATIDTQTDPVTDISYYIGTIANNALMYQECIYGVTEEILCTPVEIDLSEYVK